MPPLVSVVIPTYNHAGFLRRALQSVIDQSYSRWEAVVVDNHSQDETDEVVASFADDRIRLLKIHNHGVIAASRNMGIREAAGEWVAFLDADDCWFPGKLDAVMSAAAQDPGCDVLCNDEVMVDASTGAKRVLRYGPDNGDLYRAMILGGNRLSTSATVARRGFLTEHDLRFPESRDFVTVEDYGFWLELARARGRFHFVHEVHGEYVIHGGNYSAQRARHWQNAENLLRHHTFSVQRFHPSPARLWRQVAVRLEMAKAAQAAADGQHAVAIGLAMAIAARSPIGAARFVLGRVRRRFEGGGS